MVSRVLRLYFVAITISAICALLPSASLGQTGTPLTGIVGPGFTITLRDATGARVRHLDAGAYTITVNDLADIHNFHLLGPGVNQLTQVEEQGTVTWNVTFRDGIYNYRCDPHASSMNGRFAVGSAQLPSPAPAPTRLSGRVAARAITLTNAAGRRAARLKAGRYRITVRDVSTAQNFHLTGPGLNRRTGVAFRGTMTWTVSLRAGRYTYRSDRSRRLRGTLVVTAATSATSTHAGHGRG
jgi:hypothetical protein